MVKENDEAKETHNKIKENCNTAKERDDVAKERDAKAKEKDNDSSLIRRMLRLRKQILTNLLKPH